MPSFDEFKSKKAFKPWNETILHKVDADPIVSQNKTDTKKTLRAWDENILEQIKIVKPIENNSDTTPTQPRHNSNTNLLQSDYKPTTNLLQSGSKVVAETGSKVVANWEQTGSKVVAETGNKVVTKWEQTSNNSNTTRTQLPHNCHTIVTQPPHNCHTIPTQPPHKPNTRLSVSSLVGLQKEIILFLYESCLLAQSKITNSISIQDLMGHLKTSACSIKCAISRLENKKFISRAEYKNGRGGWSKYYIQDNLFQELLKIKSELKVESKCSQSGVKVDSNWSQSGVKVESNPIFANNSIVSLASSYTTNLLTTNLLTTNLLTTNQPARSVESLPADWQAINYEAIKAIGFGNSQIVQLYKAKLLSAQLVQESIDNFAFTLLNYPKAKEYMSPVSVLMSVLTKGNLWEKRGAPQAPAVPLNAPPEQVEEAKQQAIEREKTEELFHREYCKWYDSLSNEELKQLFPAYDLSRFRYGSVEVEAEALFRKTKWVEIYNEICAKTSEVK